MYKFSRIIVFIIIVTLAFSWMSATYDDVAKDITLGLDLQGGFEILYEVTPVKIGQAVTQDLLLHTQAALQKRVDVLGVSEPEFNIEGDNRIRVKLAGVTDHEQARRMLATEAHLTFRDVDDNLVMSRDNIREGSARVHFDDLNQPYVAIQFNDPDLTREVTQKLYQQPMVIWMDWEEGDTFREENQKPNPKYISAPIVQAVLSQDGSITGLSSYEEAKELADLLNAGALPVTLEELSAQAVGAKLGEQAMTMTVRAGIIGGILIMLYMLVYYRLPGLVASLTLVGYVYLILLVFNWMNATLTLPGIAALILGIGMAVDANILTYERMKEEIRAGKSIQSAFRLGSRRALGTIMDANITTAVAALVLFYFGSSAIQGFAVMLLVSIVLSLVTAVFGSRMLLGLLVRSRMLDGKPRWFGVKENDIGDIHLRHTPHSFAFDFIQHWRKFMTASAVLIGLGVLVLGFAGFNLGIDFESGTQLEFSVEEQQLTIAEIENMLAQIDLFPGDIRLAGNQNEIARVVFADILDREQIGHLNEILSAIYGEDFSMSETTISPVIAKELAMKAVWAILLASLGILIYVAIRFEYRFAIAAIVALLHDVLFIIAVIAIFRLEVDLTFIAAVLTVVGYSINDTIIIFDRIRENMKTAKITDRNALGKLINQSITDTFPRSINTTLTVVFAALALYLFGGEGIRNFSFALLIGLMAGAYSSIFIAAQFYCVLKARELKQKATSSHNSV
ncbi:SecD/SecF fusion protein [Caldalkalibacillus uzonensis]|uniref:Multifunctional fusion protein n=1 Tax=Caldalkalibacillus uzonensis TaxID=353224 RepID=A0ABU0CY80_9BACI|nr:protein translocase subunit SecD [Caldalkalibacillus uzonensis]MDQ0341099.1 SecD/SecF fusion protein [Caldalkalibacillus uzonensis]